MTGADRLSRFLAALRETPIPTSQPARDGRAEELGLNLLDLALNQEHIGRVSETLTLADATHLTRQVGLEIDLGALSADRLAALSADRLAVRSADRTGSTGGPGTVWLPLTRQPRRDSGWVVVSDVDGHRYPTMSPQRADLALIQGLRKVFAVYLDSGAEDSATVAGVRDRYHRSRWLIEATITAVIENGGVFEREPLPGLDRDDDTHTTDIRDRAATVVRALFTEGGAFLRMLDIAAREHLLVVRIPTHPAQHVLRYTSPGALTTSTDRRRSRLRREFTVRYQTVIPREVDTYEVTVAVPEGIQVRRFLLATATDRAHVRRLTERMRVPRPELPDVTARLAELGRRRERDLRAFKTYIEGCYATFSSRPPNFPAPPRPEPGDPGLTAPGFPVTRLARFARLYETERLHLAGGALTPAELRAWATELEAADLDVSLDFDDDPRENTGRIRWQRRPFGEDDETNSEPVAANVYMSLVDDPISLSSGVSKLVLAVLFLVAAFAVVLQPHVLSGLPVLGELFTRIPSAAEGSAATLSSADAVVTVLLLVPALLITRTQLPPRSLLGRLLVWPRFVAYASVVSVVLLALCVAALPAGSLWPPFLLVMAILALMLLLIMVDFATKTVLRRNRVPPYALFPLWLHMEASRWPRRRIRQCVANFSSPEREDDA
ncbi:MAG TPA: hypothetical protein VFV67_35820 [Actinophytocola sp.]|uniref:hypothetical protein n=1 Tax=Actinophytocola sp. TaxID=1872138 RepID=UPI002DBEA19E|nr:hypothetical protein [Actinophytocola sp.]HEU5476025.1 hypothetical protein [Actinophytocola sp.]